MIYYTYILCSEKTGRYYIGSCEDVKKRLRNHNAGYVQSTKSGVPYVLIHTEQFSNRQDAYRRERQIKRYRSGNAFKKLVQSPYSRIV